MTNRMTAEELLILFADLIQQQFNTPIVVNDAASQVPRPVGDSTVHDDAGHSSAPWAGLPATPETNLLYKMTPEVVAKMDWVMDNVPRMNRQRIVRDAVMAHLDGLIAEHYKAN